MGWILLILMMGDGRAVQVVPLATEAHCLAALKKTMDEARQDGWNGRSLPTMVCIETGIPH